MESSAPASPHLTAANHLDNLLRQTRQHHVQLSAMADRKASMLLTVSSVVATLALPQLDHPQFKPAVAILLVSSLLTLLLACYVVMPKIRLQAPTQDSEANWLFFADFHHLDYESFHTRMQAMLADPQSVYDAQLREIWQIGQYLAKKKYRVLRYAYLAFLSGFMAAGAAVLWAMWVA